MPSITFKCDETLRSSLCYQAKREGRSLSNLIRAKLTAAEVLREAARNLPPQRPTKRKP